MADSDSDPESQVNTRQQTMILDERLCTLPKTLKYGKKRRVIVCRYILSVIFVIEFHTINGIGDSFRRIPYDKRYRRQF